MLTGWQQLQWSGGTNWFYFHPKDGYMYENKCVKINGEKFCFGKNGECTSGRGC